MAKLTTSFPGMLQKVWQKQVPPVALSIRALSRIGSLPIAPPSLHFSLGHYFLECKARTSPNLNMVSHFHCLDPTAIASPHVDVDLVPIPAPLTMVMPNRTACFKPPWLLLKPPWPPHKYIRHASL